MSWKLEIAVLSIGLTWLAGACSQAPPPASPSPPEAAATAPAPTPAAAPAAAPPSGAAVAPGETPPDGVWLVDDEGRDYFVKEIPKPTIHVWLIPDQQIRLPYGDIYDVVSHDERNLRVKVYRTGPDTEVPPPAGPSEEELARAAATYVATTGEADRLRFEPFDAGLPRAGQWRNGFAIADMNGDGFLDIAHGPARKGRRRPNVFLGDGKGNWRVWSEASYPALAYDYGDVAVADFNGDGRLDMALGVHLKGLLVLASDGATGFKSWGSGLPFAVASDGTDAGFSSRALAAADWNGDGRPDVIALGEGPRLGFAPTPGAALQRPSLGMAVYLNQGDGTWVESAGAAADRRLHGEELAVGDLDGDARVDALLGSSVMGSDGLLRFNRADAWSIEALPGMRPAAIVEGVAISDLDADGRPDLLVGYRGAELRVWRSGLDLFFGKADGSYQRQALWSEAGRAGVTAVGAGDLDGDGREDVAALTGDGRTLAFLNDGTRRFRMEKSSELPAELGGCQGFDVLVRDLDGDGRAELITEFAGEASAQFAPDRCPNQGALRAWRARPTPTP